MNNDSDFIAGLDKKSHPLKSLYPLCAVIYAYFEKNGKADFFVRGESLEAVYPDKDLKSAEKEEAYHSIAYILVILAGAVIVAVLSVIARSTVLEEGNRLSRNALGEGSSEYELIMIAEGDVEKEVTVTVSEQKCPQEELESYFEKIYERLEAEVLGENSAENVTGNLNLITQITGTVVMVSWPDLNHEYVFSTGKVRHEVISEPVIIELTARLEYFDEVRLYSFPVRLMPVQEDTKELFMDRLKEMLLKEDALSAEERWFNLPDSVGGISISWSEKQENSVVLILVLGLVAAFTVIPFSRAEIKKKEKERENQMLRDYPDIISKFVLLITAGMTCRGAWEKLCNDYRRQLAEQENKSGASGKSETAVHKRYAYEEMLKAQREMNNGIPQTRVYEDFGRRCRVEPYRKFGTLLANNLRRGSKDLIDMLNAEAQEAFSIRKSTVKMRAEEAGTKLLLPMFGMLCIVFAIVMVPAFVSFGG